MTETKPMSFADFKKSHGNKLEDIRNKVVNKNKKSKFANQPNYNHLAMAYFRAAKKVQGVILTRLDADQGSEVRFFDNYQVVKQKQNGTWGVAQCNCHLGAKSVPCVPCAIAINTENPDWFAKKKGAIGVVVADYFHHVAKVSAKGTEYNHIVKCTAEEGKPNSCQHCKDGLETVFGAWKYYNVGNGHREQLTEQIATEVAGRCSSCGEGTLVISKYMCPECGECMVDCSEEELDETGTDLMQNHESVCGHCETQVRPRFEYVCQHTKLKRGKEAIVAGCDNPTPTDPFDCIIYLKNVGEGTGTQVLIDAFEPLDDEVREMLAPQPDLFAPKPFEKFLGVQSLFMQSLKLGVTNPFTREDEKLLEACYPVKKELPATAGDVSDENSAPRE